MFGRLNPYQSVTYKRGSENFPSLFSPNQTQDWLKPISMLTMTHVHHHSRHCGGLKFFPQGHFKITISIPGHFVRARTPICTTQRQPAKLIKHWIQLASLNFTWISRRWLVVLHSRGRCLIRFRALFRFFEFVVCWFYRLRWIEVSRLNFDYVFLICSPPICAFPLGFRSVDLVPWLLRRRGLPPMHRRKLRNFGCLFGKKKPTELAEF